MQQLVKLLLLAVLVCLPPSSSFAQTARRKTSKPSSPAIICKIASVPKGMVVVGYKRNAACSDGSELLVKVPENGDIICGGPPLPASFSIVTEAQGSLVGTCPNKAFLISSGSPEPATEQRTAAVDDSSITRAFAGGRSEVQVEGEGTVSRVLPDDVDGSRHQRFIIQLASGQTLLVAHNIDVAPRVAGVAAGDSVRFSGEYVWNAKGGVIHWTHHDPHGRHVAGWLKHNGKTYQ